MYPLSPEKTAVQRGQLHSLEHYEEDVFLPSAAQHTSRSEETFVHAGSKLQKIYHGAKRKNKVREAWSVVLTQMGGFLRSGFFLCVQELMKQTSVGRVVTVPQPSYERQSSLFKWQKTEEIGLHAQ